MGISHTVKSSWAGACSPVAGRQESRGPGSGHPAYYICLPVWQPEHYLWVQKIFEQKYIFSRAEMVSAP